MQFSLFPMQVLILEEFLTASWADLEHMRHIRRHPVLSAMMAPVHGGL
jgi:hypothetical protein